MPRPVPSSRAQVAVQVARGGGGDRAGTAAEAVPARGRHRTPDTGALPAPGAGVASPRPAVAPAGPSAPSRHTRAARRPAAPASLAPGSLARVEAARAAASPTPRAPARARPAAPDEEAVTDLVAGPTRRGGGVPDGPGTGRVPGLLGLVLGVLALLGALVAAAAPGVALPGGGHLGSSPPALVALLAAALLATACSGLGAGRHRAGRAVAVTGMVVGLAAVAAAVLPLVAL